jgi:hypothetical protein
MDLIGARVIPCPYCYLFEEARKWQQLLNYHPKIPKEKNLNSRITLLSA